MYTQCPDCATVYEITTEQLGAAGGLVSCGNCEATFNALRRLTSAPPQPEPEAPTENLQSELKFDAEDTISGTVDLPASGQTAHNVEHSATKAVDGSDSFELDDDFDLDLVSADDIEVVFEDSDPGELEAREDLVDELLDDIDLLTGDDDLIITEYADETSAENIDDNSLTAKDGSAEPEDDAGSSAHDSDEDGDDNAVEADEDKQLERSDADYEADIEELIQKAEIEIDAIDGNKKIDAKSGQDTGDDEDFPNTEDDSTESDSSAEDFVEIDNHSAENWNTEDGEQVLEALLSDENLLEEDADNSDEEAEPGDSQEDDSDTGEHVDETNLDESGDEQVSEDATPEVSADQIQDESNDAEDSAFGDDGDSRDDDTDNDEVDDGENKTGEQEDGDVDSAEGPEDDVADVADGEVDDAENKSDQQEDDDVDSAEGPEDDVADVADGEDDDAENKSDQQEDGDVDSAEGPEDDVADGEDDDAPDGIADGQESDYLEDDELAAEALDPVPGSSTDKDSSEPGNDAKTDAASNDGNILTQEVDGSFEQDINDAHDYRDLQHYLKPAKTLPRKIGEWIVVIALITALGAQFVHQNRESLLDHPRFGEKLREVYDRLGISLIEHWDVTEYRVARHTVVPHSEEPNVLQARATIINSAASSRPVPLVRFELQNRWGDAIFSRTFTPGEYASAPSLENMKPNGRLEVVLDLVNPTEDAVFNYHFDVCLPAKNQQVYCAADQVFTQK